LKLPFNLPQRGALTLSDQTPATEGEDRAFPWRVTMEATGPEHDPTLAPVFPPAPAIEFAQRIAWLRGPSTAIRARRRACSRRRPPCAR
jgi:hypothetical protein